MLQFLRVGTIISLASVLVHGSCGKLPTVDLEYEIHQAASFNVGFPISLGTIC